MNKLVRKDLGEYIIERRKVLGITQAELAERLGFSAQFLGRIEKGNAALPEEALKRLVAELKFNSGKIKEIYASAVDLFVADIFGKGVARRKKA